LVLLYTLEIQINKKYVVYFKLTLHAIITSQLCP